MTKDKGIVLLACSYLFECILVLILIEFKQYGVAAFAFMMALFCLTVIRAIMQK